MTKAARKRLLSWCAGEDSNLRSPKATGLQPVVIDHSTTDANSPYYNGSGLYFKALFERQQGSHERNAEHNRHDLHYALRESAVLVQLGHEVREGDVDKPARGDRE